MKKPFRYKNILLYSSLQFTGNIEEYFSEQSEKMVSYIIVPRINFRNNLVRLYDHGRLVSEKKFSLSQNIFLYYFLMYYYQWYFLMKYFGRNERIYVITFHPLSFFFMSFQKLFRNVRFVYWVADYFPPVNRLLILFERLKQFYNSRVDYVCYLSDMINQKMNGRILKTSARKTVMWGIIPRKIEQKSLNKRFSLLFVGVIRESQGLEFLFEFLKNHKEYLVNIIGDCDKNLFKKYQRVIKKYRIEKCVYFPNRFYSLTELDALAKTCHVGVALYDTDTVNATYYTDPGKVKTYTQFGLPVIMSDTSAIAPFITKYMAGIVINKREEDLLNALEKIRSHYAEYLLGVRGFNAYFSYNSYYGNAFKFME